jgi:hydroxymethylglutaryl-CoA lyase
MNDRIEIVDVSARDGLQNEPGAERLLAAEKVSYIQLLLQTGLKRIEAGSFVKPAAVPAMANTDEVALRLRSVQKRRTDVTFAYLVPNARGLERALAAEVKEVEVFLALSGEFARANIAAHSVDQSFQEIAPVIRAARAAGVRVRGYVSNVFGYDDWPFNPCEAAQRARQLLVFGCFEVALADTTGIGKPEQLAALVAALLRHDVPLAVVAMHFHDTFGTAIANVDRAYDLGIRIFDAAVGGLGGCPYARVSRGNLSTVDLIRWAESRHIAHDVTDLSKLLHATEQMRALFGKADFPAGKP